MSLSSNIVIKNKKASYLYLILDEFKAGIVLTGTEIKSIRQGKANLVESYCVFKEGELWLRGMHVAEYTFANQFNHEPKRDRKLLLNRQELRKLEKKIKEKGFTIIALQLYFSETGYAKVDIALAKGKTLGDKRESLKTKDAKRDMDRQERY
ncbi:MAG: SsrA-binding protein SmpB [Bacteroidales bacterium]|nr:SsrA-binding protein SmpB [Bacteroidales bacterium]MCF8456227.1 SsrA-binding protein SmpB [Bacteroidales bacterium]